MKNHIVYVQIYEPKFFPQISVKIKYFALTVSYQQLIQSSLCKKDNNMVIKVFTYNSKRGEWDLIKTFNQIL